jgi:folate-binding protein YgfZ
MSVLSSAVLDDRGVIAVTGPDTRAFLQGLVSNDMDTIAPDRAAWAAFLTPQGKYLHDFFVAEADGAFLLDGEKARLDDLMRRLRPYKLRSKVELARRDDISVVAVFGDGAAAAFGLPEAAGAAARFGNGVAFVDPRLAAVGVRVLLPAESTTTALDPIGAQPAPAEAYHRLRIGLGLPDGSRDMLVDKSVLLEGGFEELHGVDFKKGCYLGQEVTARTKHRGLVKRRLLPVRVDGPLPEPGTAILRDGREVGEVRSAGDGMALAFLRLDALDPAEPPLTAGAARLTPEPPPWLHLEPSAP